MNIDEIYGSKYLKAIDIVKPVVLTIKAVTLDAFPRDDQEPQRKPVLDFEEIQKRLVLNKSNTLKIVDAVGSKETDDWIGKKIMLFPDKTTFSGRLVNTISVSAPA